MKTILIAFLSVGFYIQHAIAQPSSLQKIQAAIYFDYRIYAVNAQAQKRLDSLVNTITAKPFTELHIQLYGHCDSIGDNEYNDILSTQRAEAVKAYLMTKGINDTSITVVKGLGKHQPLNNNQSETGRRFNRRVEILVELKLPEKAAPPVAAVTTKPVPDSVRSNVFDISQAKVDDIIQLPDINFFPDRHVLLRSSIKTLHKLVNTMQANKTLRIEIRGHVCCLGDYLGDAFDEDSNTKDLSLQRARVVYLYLKESGIAADRMTYVGLGGKYPLVEEFTDEDRAKNRRVEFRILNK